MKELIPYAMKFVHTIQFLGDTCSHKTLPIFNGEFSSQRFYIRKMFLFQSTMVVIFAPLLCIYYLLSKP